MSKQPFLPLFVGDFLAATAEWSGEEQSLYLLLLAYQWSLSSLPADTAKLRRMARWDKRSFDECWPTVSSKFESVDGRLLNATLEQHRSRAIEVANKRAIAGAIGGANRVANAKQAASKDQAIASTLYSHPIQSNPIHTNQEQIPKNPSALKAAPTATVKPVSIADSEPGWFVELRKFYPPRAGSQEWRRALRAANARISEGHNEHEILAGVKRYAAFIAHTGKAGTEYVKQAASFLGPEKSFLLPWALPATSAEVRQGQNISAAQRWLEESHAAS